MANPIRVKRTHFNDLVNDSAKLSGAAFTGNVSVAGNLDVTGTTTNVLNLDISDNLIGLNNGLTTSNTNDSGILIERGDLSNAFMGWDESEDKFTLATTNATAVSTGNLTLTTGTLVANLEGNVTGNAATASALVDVITNNIVQLTETQTLTNKTLTSAVLGGTTTTASGNLIVDPATQILEVKGDGSSVVGQIQLNCHNNNHGQKIKSQPHSESVSNELMLPKGADSTLVSEIATQTLTNKTFSGLTMAGDIAIAASGTKIGTATTQKLGFFNANPVVQPASAAQAAVTSQSLSDTAAGTYTQAHITKIQTELNDVTALANEMRTVLVNLGLMRGSA